MKSRGLTISESWFLILYLLAVIGFYHRILAGLASDWWNDPNYSHGFLVVPLVGYFIWEKRGALSETEPEGRWAGMAIILLASFLYLFGTVCAMEFASRISFVLWIYGSVIFLFGTSHWRILGFAMLTLLFMVPLPYMLHDLIAFPLKLVSSSVATNLLHLAGIPVLREGNLISLPTMVLEVEDACSGIRSLYSLFALACVTTYLGNRRNFVRAGVVLFVIPISLLVNASRIFVTGLLVGFGYPESAEGFFHGFSGWIVFILGLALVVGTSRLGAVIEEGYDRKHLGAN